MTVVVFDIDDTLVDHRSAERQASLLFLRRFADQLAYTEETFPQIWHDTANLHFQAFLDGECDYVTQRRRRIRAFFGEELNDAEADDLFRAYLDGYEASWQLFPDVLPCLETLDGYTLSIISNNSEVQSREKLAWFGLEDRFVDFVTPDIAGVSKPERGIFDLARARLDVTPDQLVYVGNRLDTDALAAQAAGWRGVWINRDGAPDENAGVIVIDDLRAVVDIVTGQ